MEQELEKIKPAETKPVQPFELEAGMLYPELVTEIENQVVLVKRMRLAVCKLTEAAHWRDYQGKPFLMDAGVHTIASTIGVEFGMPEMAETEMTDEDGPYREFICRLSGKWRGRSMFEIGSASTKDDFFAKSHGKKVAYKDIDIGAVRKKAITNAQHRILTKITGLGGVTWELLETIGIRPGAGGTTRFKGSEGKMTTGSGAWTHDKESLWGMLKATVGGDEALAAEKLFKLTHNPDRGYQGVRDPAALTSGQVNYWLPRIQKEYESMDAQTGPAASREPGQEG